MVKLLFFAQIQEEIGEKEMDIEAAGKSVKEIKELYLSKYKIDYLLAEAMVAINEEYASDSSVAEDGDVIAFIPPVSGG
ncbi:MAG TPA: molybdopterin converting factor subunit 1 [Pseudogracilibacillus sp.]|nr:molybdopterin converting factor subunit 1 [Pseudogracilibacillus sp.]